MIDIYFDENYGKLCEKIEGGTCEIFEHRSPHGVVRHMFIKREISTVVEGVIYYDLITPYGYGGPWIRGYKKGKKIQLVHEFATAFEEYCRENRIVSEFIRFHPIVGNALDFKDMYDVLFSRNTVGTDLSTYQDPFMAEFSKSTRKNVRRALRAGVNSRVIEKPDDLTAFKKIYYSTMDRNVAADFYYFDDDYFDMCLDVFTDNIVLVEAVYRDNVISSGLHFVYNDTMHAQLSGTLEDFLHLSPAYIVKYGALNWAKNHGVGLIHYGGGISNDKNDSLYRFKKGFGKNTEFKFFVGRKVWEPAVYSHLCLESGVEDNTGFFPAYRQTKFYTEGTE